MTAVTPNADVLALVHSDEYSGWVFDAAHPTQGRRFMLAASQLRSAAPTAGVLLTEVEASLFPTFEQLELAHSRDYIEQVLLDGVSGEWSGVRRDLGALALRMAGGTLQAVEELLAGRAMTAVNFAGAKHHAMRHYSSGFCVFNDLVIAARHVLNGERTVYSPVLGRRTVVRRIAILDIDAHHGDGTEAALRDDPRVFTFSVHDGTIFPGTGRDDDPGRHVFNRPLPSGSDDLGLESAIEDFVLFADRFSPDLIFIAIGADGHETDPLSSLTYTAEGMERAVRLVRRAFASTPILLGGAGGYQPDDVTPEAWVRMALAAATPVAPGNEFWVEAIGDIGYLDDPDERAPLAVGEHLDAHLAAHAHLFAHAPLPDRPEPPRAAPVEWVAPADPEGEHRWVPARIGQIRPGEKVRVLRDAFADETIGRRHNGRICEVIEVRDGDVICRSIDNREPVLTGTHYAPYDLEQCAEDAPEGHNDPGATGEGSDHD
jgi:acetoin utilization protein AcuC